MANAYRINPKQITVQAQDLGIPRSDFDSRLLNEIFAFRADFQHRALTVYGCNTAAPGDPAFIKHPDGIAALMKAARVLEEQESLPAADLALLVAWIYHDLGAPVDPSAATVERSGGGAVLSYLARAVDGSVATRIVTAKVQPSYVTTVTSKVAGAPEKRGAD